MSLARPFNTRPLYQQVADEFLSRIVTGKWTPGQPLENETDIARSLGISLGTARKAFDILVEQHVLERHQGRGTFVPDMQDDAFRSRFSNLRDAHGHRVSGEAIIGAVHLGVPSRAVAEALEVNERTPILFFERRRHHEGRLYLIEDVHLRVETSARDMGEAQLREVAKGRWTGYDLATRKRETVAAITSSAADAAEFGIAPGTGLLRLDRVIRSYHERPLEYRIGRCHLGPDLHYSCG